jgi:hypothetical protein
MMRPILAPKFMEGIQEKLLKSRSKKIGPKIPPKIKNIAAQDRRRFSPNTGMY